MKSTEETSSGTRMRQTTVYMMHSVGIHGSKYFDFPLLRFFNSEIAIAHRSRSFLCVKYSVLLEKCLFSTEKSFCGIIINQIWLHISFRSGLSHFLLAHFSCFLLPLHAFLIKSVPVFIGLLLPFDLGHILIRVGVL